MRPILTDKRKYKLADYMLNLSVASFAVAAFGGQSWGVFPGFVTLGVFFILNSSFGLGSSHLRH